MKLQVTGGPEDRTANERKREVRNENVEGRKQGERKVNRQENEEEERLRAMFLKCRPSTELQNDQLGANGVFGGGGRQRDGVGQWTEGHILKEK